MEHRAFQIYSTPVPVLRELLGRISEWHLAGSIDYRRRDRSLVELTRFRLPSISLMNGKLRSTSVWSLAAYSSMPAIVIL